MYAINHFVIRQQWVFWTKWLNNFIKFPKMNFRCLTVMRINDKWVRFWTAVTPQDRMHRVVTLCRTWALINSLKPSQWLLYRVSRGECARLRDNAPYVKVHRSNPKHLYPKLNGYGNNGERKVWSSCGSTYCACFAYCYSYTAHVRPSVSQPSQAHSDFIINRCHSYSEL